LTESQTWPVCHVRDNTGLYLHLLRQILEGKNPGSGKHGYYLASPGSVAWNDLYIAMAAALKKRGRIADSTVLPADEAALSAASKALDVSSHASVEVAIGG